MLDTALSRRKQGFESLWSANAFKVLAYKTGPRVQDLANVDLHESVYDPSRRTTGQQDRRLTSLEFCLSLRLGLHPEPMAFAPDLAQDTGSGAFCFAFPCAPGRITMQRRLACRASRLIQKHCPHLRDVSDSRANLGGRAFPSSGFSHTR